MVFRMLCQLNSFTQALAKLESLRSVAALVYAKFGDRAGVPWKLFDYFESVLPLEKVKRSRDGKCRNQKYDGSGQGG